MTTVITDEMLRAGALEFSIRHQSTCYPNASDWECEYAAKTIYLAMSTASQPPAEDAVERVLAQALHCRLHGAHYATGITTDDLLAAIQALTPEAVEKDEQ